MKTKFKKALLRIALLVFGVLILFTNGCMPAFTRCKGYLKIQNQQSNGDERFVVVSFWDYPVINNSKGRIIVNEVIATESKILTIDFPVKTYTVIWTPALGTQHLAPEPGILVFSKNYFPSWNIGGTEDELRICCGPPKSEHEFEIKLLASPENLFEENKYFTKAFFEKLLDNKKDLLNKLRKCEGLTDEEEEMVLANLSRIEEIFKREFAN